MLSDCILGRLPTGELICKTRPHFSNLCPFGIDTAYHRICAHSRGWLSLVPPFGVSFLSLAFAFFLPFSFFVLLFLSGLA